MTDFHKEVSPDILPEYLGGKILDNEYADLEFNRNLFAKDEYYKGAFLIKYNFKDFFYQRFNMFLFDCLELFRYGYFSNDGQG